MTRPLHLDRMRRQTHQASAARNEQRRMIADTVTGNPIIQAMLELERHRDALYLDAAANTRRLTGSPLIH